MKLQTLPPFFFSPRNRLLRHSVYWCCYVLIWSSYWTLVGSTFSHNVIRILMWLPIFMLYSYPVAYIAVPKLLLQNKFISFSLVIIGWGILGWYINSSFRAYLFFPISLKLGMEVYGGVANPATFLCMTTTAGCISISTLAKRWFLKQQEWMQAEQEKVTAQLQVLKAQLHPHFLFNTLNNIYAFALEGSTKTPSMVLRLSSLLSYMLYDCKEDEVLLEKEIEVMRNYIDLEKERYGDKLDISINIEGEIADHYIAPLLILPFLENAFKHGTSEQLDHPWMSVDIMVKNNRLQYKVVNSKDEDVPHHDQGVGICNIQRRLELLYEGKHELKLTDEGVFFVASLMVELKGPVTHQKGKKKFSYITKTSKVNEDSLSAHR